MKKFIKMLFALPLTFHMAFASCCCDREDNQTTQPRRPDSPPILDEEDFSQNHVKETTAEIVLARPPIPEISKDSLK